MGTEAQILEGREIRILEDGSVLIDGRILRQLVGKSARELSATNIEIDRQPDGRERIVGVGSPENPARLKELRL